MSNPEPLPPPTSNPPDPLPPFGDNSEAPAPTHRWRRLLFGTPRDLTDSSLFHRISLIPFLAWVGMGADGLSSSSYGPEEAFRALGSHTYLAALLALVIAATVFIFSAAYSRIIEDFPSGGGGYVVASKLLGPKAGLVSGCALLVDYVLTITVSIAAAGDAIFSPLPMEWHFIKIPVEIMLILGLTTINIRGVRESVILLTPIFVLFLITHLLIIVGVFAKYGGSLPHQVATMHATWKGDVSTIGGWGLLLLFLHAYSLGGGTFTGIEAVSNGVTLMREPRVRTAKRTMVYMATSLAFFASGLMLCYLLIGIHPVPGKTLNGVLVEQITAGFSSGHLMVGLTLFSEAVLLIVAAQAGFIDGPRVLASMALDSWVPRRLAALSERLTSLNGDVFMGLASLAALLYTRGNVQKLVIMYSINVFLTFSFSMFGMIRSWAVSRHRRKNSFRQVALFFVSFPLCLTILVITVFEKFREGGWLTLLVTGSLVMVCFWIRSHYRTVARKLARLDLDLLDIGVSPAKGISPLDPSKPTAVLLVGSYNGLGIHSALTIQRTFPGHYKNIIFISIGVVSSQFLKGENHMGELDDLRVQTETTLKKYVDLAERLGMPSTYRFAIGTDIVEEADQLCRSVAREFPNVTYFAGTVIFARETWYHRILHNETAFSIQKRLHWDGKTMIILPVRVK